MSTKRPPRAAMFLLARFGAGPCHEPLLGDLVEEWHGGKSRGWFWRQTLTAIAAMRLQDLRDHKWLAARAFLLGWPALLGAAFASDRLTVITRAALSEWLYRNAYYSMEWFVWSSQAPEVFFTCVMSAACGWVVARLHAKSLSAFLLFALSVAILHLRVVIWFGEIIYRGGHGVPVGSWVVFATLIGRPLTLFIGGMLASGAVRGVSRARLES